MKYYRFKDFNKTQKWTKETLIIYAYLAFIVHFSILKMKSSLTPPSEILIFYFPFDVKIKILIFPETWLPFHQLHFWQWCPSTANCSTNMY